MIRATSGYRDVPAVALTGFAHDAERQAFLDGGFQAVVVKPVLDHEELLALIDRLANPPPTHLPTPSAATHLDGGVAITALRRGGSGETEEQGPA